MRVPSGEDQCLAAPSARDAGQRAVREQVPRDGGDPDRIRTGDLCLDRAVC